MKIAMCVALAVALAAVVLFPQPVKAEVNEGDQIVSLDLGMALPAGKLHANQDSGESFKTAKMGLLAGFQCIYQVTPNIGLGAGFLYSAYGKTKHATPVNNKAGDYIEFSQKNMTFEALGRYVFMPETKFNPYAVMGVGFNRGSLKGTSNSPASIPAFSEEFINGSYTSLAFSLGGGFETEVVQSVIAGFEARWRYMGKHTYPDKTVGTDSYASGPNSEMMLAARVGYKFSEE